MQPAVAPKVRDFVLSARAPTGLRADAHRCQADYRQCGVCRYVPFPAMRYAQGAACISSSCSGLKIILFI